jgi:hypothetical protein
LSEIEGELPRFFLSRRFFGTTVEL